MLVDLRHAARTDGLTGLLNRSAVLADGQAQLQRVRQQGRPLALLLVDVDHFKQINDRWGHLAGDQDAPAGPLWGRGIRAGAGGQHVERRRHAGGGDPHPLATAPGGAGDGAGCGHRQRGTGHGRGPG
ncbi:hypothetical protein G6F23_014868 [Rhizopus arrhizus]|nr:hypothetical protein G6F23_014868 [Rhizopus arrhizus]